MNIVVMPIFKKIPFKSNCFFSLHSKVLLDAYYSIHHRDHQNAFEKKIVTTNKFTLILVFFSCHILIFFKLIFHRLPLEK